MKDFVLTYFPLHGLHSEAFFDYIDVLVFVEGFIYQLDEENEELASVGDAHSAARGFDPLEAVLQRRRLLNPAVKAELSDGVAYWLAERHIAACMHAHPVVPAKGHDIGITLQQVHTTSAKKSFDYRVLNLVLFALRDADPSQQLMEFLRVDEMLLDIGDDLVDYEDDVLGNCFNIYRAYVHLFGLEAELKLVCYIMELETQHSQLLACLPGDTQAFYQRRMVAAAEGPGALRWSIPAPILDEANFRKEFGR